MVDEYTVLSIRGTTNPAGWVSNFKTAGVIAEDHPQLGVCESGFLKGALALWPLISPLLNGPNVIVQGHSRGAGMVPILAGLMLLAGAKPARVVCWEAPWAVGRQCQAMLIEGGVSGVQWWHGDDPVPCIPAVPWLRPYVWPITHFGPWMLNPFDCHHMAGIVATLTLPAVGTPFRRMMPK
jgi:hypothetical protein